MHFSYFLKLYLFTNLWPHAQGIYLHIVVVQSLSRVPLFAMPWTIAHQAPLSMGIFWARMLEWVSMPSSRGSSQPRDWTQITCIAGRFLPTELEGKPKWKRKSLSHVELFVTSWTIQSMGFPRQEYWSGLPFPPPGDLPDTGIKPASLMSPVLVGRYFTTSDTWEALNFYV